MEAKIWKCGDCDAVFADENQGEGSVYECGNCGTRFTYGSNDSNRCPDCGKFSAKQGDEGCPDCQEGVLEETDGYLCEECDEVFEDEEQYIEHMKESHDYEEVENAEGNTTVVPSDPGTLFTEPLKGDTHHAEAITTDSLPVGG